MSQISKRKSGGDLDFGEEKKSLLSALFVLILTNISGFNLNGSVMSYINDKRNSEELTTDSERLSDLPRAKLLGRAIAHVP